MEAREIQLQYLYAPRSEEANRILLLNNLPSLSLSQGFALDPKIHKQALELYRNLTTGYPGASSFAAEADLESWAEVMGAVSNLGWFGSSQDADLLIKVYEKVPTVARPVSATAVMRALLCLNMPEKAAVFAQRVAKDGALSKEFSLGVQDVPHNVPAPSEAELVKMKNAVVQFQPYNAIHFDPSFEATAKWLSLNRAVQKAEPVAEVNEEQTLQKFIASLDLKELNEILAGRTLPVLKGKMPQEISNLVAGAKAEWARRFSAAFPELTKGVAVEEIVQMADYTRYKNPWEVLHQRLTSRQHFLADKKAKFSIGFRAANSMEELNALHNEFLALSTEFPQYDWGNLGEVFAEQKQQLNAAPAKVAALRTQVQSLQNKILNSKLMLEKGFAFHQQYNRKNKKQYNDILEEIQLLQQNPAALSLLEEYNIVELFLKPHETYFRNALKSDKLNNYRHAFEDLQKEFQELSGMFPQHNWRKISREMAARKKIVDLNFCTSLEGKASKLFEKSKQLLQKPDLHSLRNLHYDLKYKYKDFLRLHTKNPSYPWRITEEQFQQELEALSREIKRLEEIEAAEKEVIIFDEAPVTNVDIPPLPQPEPTEQEFSTTDIFSSVSNFIKNFWKK
uniref:Uncharacterized protein n=1 Tax=uncultured Elusimicrobia bacterium TaxID=699876 RepID=A0A650ELA4_9BACT|nr:hypothetical protein Elusimicrob1349_0470 [uncultured Elusimicrobia bacterium]